MAGGKGLVRGVLVDALRGLRVDLRDSGSEGVAAPVEGLDVAPSQAGAPVANDGPEALALQVTDQFVEPPMRLKDVFEMPELVGSKITLLTINWEFIVTQTKIILSRMKPEDVASIDLRELRTALLDMLHRRVVYKVEMAATIAGLVAKQSDLVFPEQGDALAEQYEMMTNDPDREFAVGGEPLDYRVYVGTKNDHGTSGYVKVDGGRTVVHTHPANASVLPTTNDAKKARIGVYDLIIKPVRTMKLAIEDLESALFAKMDAIGNLIVRVIQWRGTTSNRLDGVLVYAKEPVYNEERQITQSRHMRLLVPLNAFRKASETPQEVSVFVPELGDYVVVVVEKENDEGSLFRVTVPSRNWGTNYVEWPKSWNDQDPFTVFEANEDDVDLSSLDRSTVWHGKGASRPSNPVVKVSYADYNAREFLIPDGAKVFALNVSADGLSQEDSMAFFETVDTRFAGGLAEFVKGFFVRRFLVEGASLSNFSAAEEVGGLTYLKGLELSFSGKRVLTIATEGLSASDIMIKIDPTSENPVHYLAGLSGLISTLLREQSVVSDLFKSGMEVEFSVNALKDRSVQWIVCKVGGKNVLSFVVVGSVVGILDATSGKTILKQFRVRRGGAFGDKKVVVGRPIPLDAVDISDLAKERLLALAREEMQSHPMVNERKNFLEDGGQNVIGRFSGIPPMEPSDVKTYRDMKIISDANIERPGFGWIKEIGPSLFRLSREYRDVVDDAYNSFNSLQVAISLGNPSEIEEKLADFVTKFARFREWLSDEMVRRGFAHHG